MMMDPDQMATGMMWGMGFAGLLGLIFLLLAIADLAKYVFGGK